MPVVIALLLGAFGAYLWFDRRRDASQTPPALPPGDGGIFNPTLPPIYRLPQGTVQPVILPGEVSAFVQQGNAATDPRIPILLADALERTGYPAEGQALRIRAIEMLNIPASDRLAVNQAMKQMPLDLTFAALTGLVAGTPASLNRAAWIARSQNQPALATIIQQRNPSPNNTGNFQFTPPELIALVQGATGSSDPIFKLATAELLDQFLQVLSGTFTGPDFAGELRTQVLESITQTNAVARDPNWLTMMSALPLSYQNIILTMIGTGDPQAKERAATIAGSVAAPYGPLIRSL